MLSEIINYVTTDIWRIRLKDHPRKKIFFVTQLRVVILALRGFYEDKCSLRASALTFYSLLSIVPVVSLIFGIAKGFGSDKALEKQLLEKFPGQEEVLMQVMEFARTLLDQTKNKESNYLTLLEEKREARAEFERELLDFESQLKIAIDPTSFASPQEGILAWPLDKIRITQEFGDTSFARGGAYNGRGHNGADFGAPQGTPVRAVLSGTVAATGNTDAFPGCYSYGKWSLIQHNNGLSSLYAHLSHISLGKGSQVLTGQVIGYSGNTGYSTGPHLHLGLFATQGVRLVQFKDIKAKTNCAEATVPVAPLNAYLDPLAYLPAL